MESLLQLDNAPGSWRTNKPRWSNPNHSRLRGPKKHKETLPGNVWLLGVLYIKILEPTVRLVVATTSEVVRLTYLKRALGSSPGYLDLLTYSCLSTVQQMGVTPRSEDGHQLRRQLRRALGDRSFYKAVLVCGCQMGPMRLCFAFPPSVRRSSEAFGCFVAAECPCTKSCVVRFS